MLLLHHRSSVITATMNDRKYKPLSKRETRSPKVASTAISPAVHEMTAAANLKPQPRRRSTVDTPYGQHASSQHGPVNRKSWAETDWDELEYIWSREVNQNNDKLIDDLLHNKLNADDENRWSTGDWREPDSYFQLEKERRQQQLLDKNAVDLKARPRASKRRVTI